MAQGVEIRVENRTRQRLPLAFLRSSAKRIVRELGIARASVSVLLVNSQGMAKISGAYRKKSKPTNVLAFPYSNGVKPRVLVGDIVLCVPVIRREAKKEGIIFRLHLAALMLHAMVHLADYTHDRPVAARRMEKIEQRILRRLGIRTVSKVANVAKVKRKLNS